LRTHNDGYWRVVKKYYNLVGFIFVDNSGKILIGVNSVEGMFGSYIESPDNTANIWSDDYTSQNRINNLKMYNDTLYLAKYGGVAVSGDEGKNWDELSNFTNTDVTDFAINKNTGSFFISTISKGILKSGDKGKTWKQTGFKNRPFYSLSSSNNEYICALSGKLFITKDDGNSWNELQIGEPATLILSFTFTSKDYLVAGTENDGIFVSENYGNIWENKGLKNYKIYSLRVDSDNYIYAGTESHGILKSKNPL